jgi:hypothetical protein
MTDRGAEVRTPASLLARKHLPCPHASGTMMAGRQQVGKHRRSGRHRLGTSERPPRPRTVPPVAAPVRWRGGRVIPLAAGVSAVLLVMSAASLAPEPVYDTAPDDDAPGSVLRLPRIPELRIPAVTRPSAAVSEPSLAAQPERIGPTRPSPAGTRSAATVRAATHTTAHATARTTTRTPVRTIADRTSTAADPPDPSPTGTTTTVDDPPTPTITSPKPSPPEVTTTSGRRDPPRWCRSRG